MPETMRLNVPVACPGCALYVNPYVVERTIEQYPLLVKLECPTCKYEWMQELDLDE